MWQPNVSFQNFVWFNIKITIVIIKVNKHDIKINIKKIIENCLLYKDINPIIIVIKIKHIKINFIIPIEPKTWFVQFI